MDTDTEATGTPSNRRLRVVAVVGSVLALGAGVVWFVWGGGPHDYLMAADWGYVKNIFIGPAQWVRPVL
jgi:hypothetical protein